MTADFATFVADRFGGFDHGSHTPNGAACYHEAQNVYEGHEWSHDTTGTTGGYGCDGIWPGEVVAAHPAPRDEQPGLREALDGAIEGLLGTDRPPSTDKGKIVAWELAASRLRVAYGAVKGWTAMCPVPSSATGMACLLPEGHGEDSPTRFHRYPTLASPSAVHRARLTALEAVAEAARDVDNLLPDRPHLRTLNLSNDALEAVAALRKALDALSDKEAGNG